MSGFSAEWLALREPADIAARSTAVTRFVVGALEGRPMLRIADLGSGTGSNVRYLSSRLPHAQEWRLVDHDAVLLGRASSLLDGARATCQVHVADLRDLDSAIFNRRDLVTASALLDLVSEAWLREFVRHCRGEGAAVLVVLNYDGRITCSPSDPDDEFVRALVNRHQRTDKGFGPALGPDAGTRVDVLLRDAGYEVLRRKSDWVLGSTQAELQRELLAGWAGAAAELALSDARRIRAWEARRVAHVNSGLSTIVVGHDDVGAIPQDRGI